jgi:nucleoside-diphosphate-sugar epimerase
VVNLATGRLLSVRHFVESAAKELGIPQDRLGFGALPTREDEMFHEPVMNRRLIDLTGWMPPVTIAEGVRLTLEREPSVSRGSAPAAVF